MRSIHQMSPNFHIKDENKEVQDVIVGDGHGISEEDESRINELAEDINGGRGEDVAPLNYHVGLQKQRQPPPPPPPGPIVRWERFLPVRTLKVLLAENDDSTRQVLTALLRNCSYEVTATANGVQAWKILEDLNNHVDLVLTEVVMPCLSGYGLLCKIMNHKTCKNIPVIMMSSNDSMGTVFKCLSKGAVDFLVKPIRKNELKNLWQHVWRRCHSSSGSGSGSESGIQTQKSAQSPDDYDKNSGSNDEDDNGSIGLNVKDGSDNGSGTQSSWTRRAVEIDSPRSMSPADQLADPHDSTCAQVIHPKPETFCNGQMPMTTAKESQEQKILTDSDLMAKGLEIGVLRNPVVQHEFYPTERVSNDQTGTNVDKLHVSDPKRVINHTMMRHENSNAGEPSPKAADLFGGTTGTKNAQQVMREIDAPSGFSKISESKGKTIADSNELPSLELSLKRLRPSEEGGTNAHGDHNILRHSDLSAFSRYSTSAASAQAPTGCGGYCSIPRDNNSEPVKTESTQNMISNLNAAPLKQGSNGSCDNNDMGSTTKNAFTKPPAVKEKMTTTSPVKFMKPFSAFHTLQQQAPAAQQVMQEKVDDRASAALVGQARGLHCQVQVQHHHHHNHHHVHSMQQQQQQPQDDVDLSLKNMATPTLQCGSSNVFMGQMEGNAANYSLNGSNSGSNHGGNGQNGSSTAVYTGTMGMDIDNRLAGISGAGGGTGSGSRSGIDQNWMAQREAALKKFQQKRKQRNFEKKVRYQSRKKLAEQRPRVRGQFVRQNACEREHKKQDADS